MSDMKLVDAGAHSVGANNALEIVSATPEFVISNAVEFVVSGGTASAPELQHTQSGLISADTELWLKFSGVAGLTKVTVGGADEGTGTGWGDEADAGTTAGMLSGYGGASINAANLVDGVYNSGTGLGGNVVSGTGIMIDLGAGADKRLSKIVLGYDGNGTVHEWAIKWSDNGSSWTTEVASWTAVASGNKASISFTPSAVHRYWLLVCVTSLNTYNIDEIDLYYTPANRLYTLSNLSPAQASLPEKAYKLRADTSKALMALACGATGEPLDKETALTLAGSGTTASQVVVTGSSSLLPFFASGNLSRDLIVTVGGVDYVVQQNGEVTETGTGPYTTTIPIPAQASAPTAARLRSRFQTPVDIASVTYATGPLLTVRGVKQTLSGATLKRLALKLRGDTTLGLRAKLAKIYIEEMV